MLKVHPKFIVRTPLFSFSDLFQRSGKLSDNSLSTSILQDPVFRDVISFSSKDFFEAVLQHGKASGKKLERIEETILKYLIRICTRPTNFSILGTYSIGEFSDEFSLIKSKDDQYTFYSSTDMVLLYSLYKQIDKENIISQCKLYLNNTIYKSGDNGFKYFERSEGDSFKFNFTLSHFESSDVLEVTLPHLKAGVTANELLTILQDSGYELSLENLLEFLNDLFDHNIIITSLDPITSIRDYEKILGNFFKANQQQKQIKLLETLNGISHRSLGEFHTALTEVSGQVEELGISLSKQTLLNIETKRHFSQNSLPEAIKEDLVTAFKVLATVSEKIELPEMDEFSEAFFKLYENEFVPLTSVLDPEAGLGYPINSAIKKHKSVFLSNLNYSSNGNGEKSSNPFQYITTFRPKEGPLNLNELNGFELPSLRFEQLYSTYYSKFNLVKTDSSRSIICIDEFIGPSAGRIMARQSEDPEIASLIKEMTAADESFFKSGIVAEIVFCPQVRAANIFNNNNTFKHQISLLNPQEPADNVIEVNDLFLTYRNGRINLFSKKLDKFVFPILTNSYNYSLTHLPVYNFLCDLQHQHTYLGAVRWKWPDHLKNLHYLPRVQYKNIILFKAKWTIKSSKDLSFEGFQNLLERKISEMGMPKFVSMHDRGSSIFLNLEDSSHVGLAYKLFSKTGTIDLEEFVFNVEDIPTKVDGKAYINEYICFIENKSSIATVRKPLISITTEKYNLGSEWIYVKIFCSPLKASQLLISVVQPLMDKVESDYSIKNWHYLRFIDDQKFHIRLRLQLKNAKYFQVALNNVIEMLNSRTDLIESYLFDTFQPEVSRYGGPDHYIHALDFFTEDSRYSLQLLEKNRDFGPWAILKSIDQYLSDFGLETSQKATFCEISTLNYREEYGLASDKVFAKSIFTKYRSNKAAIFATMENLKMENILAKRSTAISSTIESLKRNDQNFDTVFESLLHIHIIRMLDARQRYQEMIIYDLLAIYYREMLHRIK